MWGLALMLMIIVAAIAVGYVLFTFGAPVWAAQFGGLYAFFEMGKAAKAIL